MHLKSSVFRHDINGLRAWAVIAVVLFHFGIPGFGGGFVGVDIFFVISGFLMTQIIVKGIETEKFSIWQFYLARARRIIPALLALCSALLLFGWFFLTTSDYTTLSKHVLTAILFISNVKFWRESGYFDAASHEKWLLHTWSLSVEWQFYIILPIVLIIMWRFRRAPGLKIAIFGGFILSFALSCYMAITIPSAAFFLLPTRAWEMLGGGIVWWLTQNKSIDAGKAKLMEASGFVLIIISIVFFNPKMYWPGLYALVPVMGAMLVLAAARQKSIFTANYAAERIGVSSYSIYLWHWPVVVFLTYNNESNSSLWIACGIILSLILGELSLRLIENPTRKWLSTLPPWREFFTIATCMVIICGISVALFKLNISNRVPADIDLISNESLNIKPNRAECFSISGTVSPACVYGGKDIKVVLLGDSHADSITTALEAALPSKNDGVLDLTYAGCPTIYASKTVPGKVPDNQLCYEFNQWERKKLSSIDSSIPAVIVNRTSNYAFGHPSAPEKERSPFVYFTDIYKTPEQKFLSEFKNELIKTACDIASERTVYMVRPLPEMPLNVPKNISRAMMFGDKKLNISISESEYMQRHSFVWKAQDEAAEKCGVKILNPVPYLCKNGICEGTHNGRPIYYDDNHMSEYGNKLLIPMFRETF